MSLSVNYFNPNNCFKVSSIGFPVGTIVGAVTFVVAFVAGATGATVGAVTFVVAFVTGAIGATVGAVTFSTGCSVRDLRSFIYR